MKEVTFRVNYDGGLDILNTLEACNQALKGAGVSLEFVTDDEEHDGFEVVTLKPVDDA